CSMIAVLNWSLDHWWVFFWLAICGVLEGVRGFFLGLFRAVAAMTDRRHKQRRKEPKLRATIGSATALPPATPGPCGHRQPAAAACCRADAAPPAGRTAAGPVAASQGRVGERRTPGPRLRPGLRPVRQRAAQEHRRQHVNTGTLRAVILTMICCGIAALFVLR